MTARICPVCGKKTVIEAGDHTLLSLPPKYREREWCGCGWRSDWYIKSHPSNPTLQELWEAENEENL